MPLSRIEIEQTSHTTWVAEVEAGGISAKRERVLGNSFEQVMERAYTAYRTMIPADREPGAPALAPGKDALAPLGRNPLPTPVPKGRGSTAKNKATGGTRATRQSERPATRG